MKQQGRRLRNTSICFKGNILKQQEDIVNLAGKKKGSVRRKRITMENNLNGHKMMLKASEQTQVQLAARPQSCKSRDSAILSDKADILNRWKKYFQNLYGMTKESSEMPPQQTAIY
ncbi:hypothetical protein B7P43_G17807 [Cryptotermes secundus]|uniref:Uncharacterized protein n=1 Tax=Cryptotermes secundus TaxID=105785 RepID=A0A2J7RIU9_9NEOP|nr:hypothetical protein B7P43_G17807 [Cryptotermes secundus]